MSDPKKDFTCGNGHITNDRDRTWGNQSPCIRCSVEKAKIRVTAKCHLTDLQYNGGPGLTPADNAAISNVLLLCFGNFKCRVPDVCTTQWGFKAWADWIGDPRWTT